MATFIALLRFTERGAQAVKESVQRAGGNRALGEQLGVTVNDIYWTLGQYDVVMLLEAANDETVTAFLLSMGAKGMVSSQTLRAFSAEEFAAIVGRMA